MADTVMAHDGKKVEKGVMFAKTYAIRGRDGHAEIEMGGDQANALRVSPASAYSSGVVIPTGLRRLMPLECERLQGMPDNWTLIPGASDSARYMAIGNSMAVPVMRWIGERIQMVEGIQCAA